MSPSRAPRVRVPAAVAFLPACFIVEVILGGPSGIHGGISVRFLLFGASCAVLTLALLMRGWIVGSHVHPAAGIAGFLVLNGVWVALVPALVGTDTLDAMRESHSLVVLLLVMLVVAVLRHDQLERALRGLQQVVVLASLLLAVFQIGLWMLGSLLGELRWIVPVALQSVFPGSSDQLYVGPMPDGFFRVFWISTLWCLLSFFWLPVAFPNWSLRGILRLVLLFDLFVAYSRGIWAGLLVGVVVAQCALLSSRGYGRRVTRSVVAGALAAATLAAVLTTTGFLELGVSRFRSTTSRTDESIGARVEQAPFLLQLWEEHPILGSGYGAHTPRHVRSQEAPFSYEHMPYALLAKLGIAGVLVAGGFLTGWLLSGWRARMRAPLQAASFLGGVTSFLIAAMTNPMLLNFVSMSILACLLFQWVALAARPTTEPAHVV